MTPPDPPTRGKKIPFKFTFKHFMISIVLFNLMLAGITLVEMATKSHQLRQQKQRVAEAICIANDLNGTDAELDNCIEVYLIVSESFEVGVSPEETAARIDEDISTEEVRKIVNVWLDSQLKSQRSTTQLSQIRHRIAEISEG